MILSYRGLDIEWPLTIALMWLGGVAFTIGKANQLTAPDIEIGQGVLLFHIFFGTIWWGLLLLVTLRLIFLVIA